jgi:LmbE family N-acetylglucosaminyl deacetylase
VADLAILGCYAHPDDEQGIAGTLRKCIEEGIRTGLIVATRGEVGEIADPGLATPETLGEVREQEMRKAAEVIGIHNLYFLDYRDSGMDGTPENKDPRAFVNADETEAVGRIVKIVREFKPTVMVTFDPTGGYGHPDHLAIHRWAIKAFHAAGDPAAYPEAGPAFAPQRLLYGSIPRSVRNKMTQLMKEMNVPSFFATLPADKYGLPDEDITNVMDVGHYMPMKRRSMGAHRTQLDPNSAFMRFPEEITNQLRGKEYFALAAGTPFPPNADKSDLFAGLR